MAIGINHDIPEDIVGEIMKWLPPMDLVRCGRVCKTWRKASLDPSIWTQKLSPIHHNLPDRCAGFCVGCNLQVALSSTLWFGLNMPRYKAIIHSVIIGVVVAFSLWHIPSDLGFASAVAGSLIAFTYPFTKPGRRMSSFSISEQSTSWLRALLAGFSLWMIASSLTVGFHTSTSAKDLVDFLPSLWVDVLLAVVLSTEPIAKRFTKAFRTLRGGWKWIMKSHGSMNGTLLRRGVFGGVLIALLRYDIRFIVSFFAFLRLPSNGNKRTFTHSPFVHLVFTLYTLQFGFSSASWIDFLLPNVVFFACEDLFAHQPAEKMQPPFGPALLVIALMNPMLAVCLAPLAIACTAMYGLSDIPWSLLRFWSCKKLTFLRAWLSSKALLPTTDRERQALKMTAEIGRGEQLKRAWLNSPLVERAMVFSETSVVHNGYVFDRGQTPFNIFGGYTRYISSSADFIDPSTLFVCSLDSDTMVCVLENEPEIFKVYYKLRPTHSYNYGSSILSCDLTGGCGVICVLGEDFIHILRLTSDHQLAVVNHVTNVTWPKGLTKNARLCGGDTLVARIDDSLILSIPVPSSTPITTSFRELILEEKPLACSFTDHPLIIIAFEPSLIKCYDAKSLDQIWQFDGSGTFESWRLVMGGLILQLGIERQLINIDTATGQVLSHTADHHTQSLSHLRMDHSGCVFYESHVSRGHSGLWGDSTVRDSQDPRNSVRYYCLSPS